MRQEIGCNVVLPVVKSTVSFDLLCLVFLVVDIHACVVLVVAEDDLGKLLSKEVFSFVLVVNGIT